MKVLGISCSLRNARYGVGSTKLIEEISGLGTEPDLMAFLEAQTKIRAEDFIAAGRGDKLPFDAIYRNLRKARGDRGLSNSEAALVAGLWGAHQQGAEIQHIGLGAHFPMNGEARGLGDLRRCVLQADALLLSGPVYFGDRGSLAQEFIEFLHSDPECTAHVRDRLYAGIAVGAKRNGGQETTLIYQIVDATNLNMLAVGNDSETTSQYGGTALAGDVGTLHKDEYGIKTSIGTGRRLARVGRLLETGSRNKMIDRVKIQVWLLQDQEDGRGHRIMQQVADGMMSAEPSVQVDIKDFTNAEIYRCIACDVCPTQVGAPEVYRCIINADGDLFRRKHEELIDADAILIAAYSPINRRSVRSVYQRFMERTRYLRRDDYVIGDRLVAPFVISQVGANQNLHIRMLTSFVRHHSILHHPLIGFEHEGQILNWDPLLEQAKSFAANATRLTAGRLSSASSEATDKRYNPVGYIISKEKHLDDAASGVFDSTDELRRLRHEKARDQRIA